MATADDDGFIGGSGPQSPRGFGLEVPGPDYSSDDKKFTFQAGAAAEEAERIACRGNMGNAHAKLLEAQGYADSINDPSWKDKANNWVKLATAFVAAQEPNAQANTEATVLADGQSVIDHTASPADIEAERLSQLDTARAQKARDAGLDPNLAYLGIPDPGGALSALNLTKGPLATLAALASYAKYAAIAAAVVVAVAYGLPLVRALR